MIFHNDQYDPGPEEEEDLPESTGFKRFWEIFQDECVSLIKLNLLFLVSCIPVATIPPALFAAHQVAQKMVLGDRVRCWQDYKAAFKAGWKQGYGAFFLTILPMVVGGYGMVFYLKNVERSVLLILPFALCAFIFWMVALGSTYLYGLLYDGRTLKQAIRPAVLLAMAKPLRAILAAVCWYVLPLAVILLFPLSGPILLLIGFSLPFLLGSFYTRTVLKQFHDARAEA